MSKTSLTSSRGYGLSIVVAAMMLFSMFFGAGNLIFPAMLGAQSGENFWPAIIGFISTGVVLPALAVIAVAMTGKDMSALTMRGGKIFGTAYPVLIYLSIGAFFALPRTASVTYSTTVAANAASDELWMRVVFSAIYFAVAVALAFEPSGIVDKLGKYITPLLLILLLLMIVMGSVQLHNESVAAVEPYSDSAFAAGFVEGYLTMDSLAGLAFGILVLNAFAYKGIKSGAVLVRGVGLAAVIACVLLGLVYTGLASIGLRLENGQGFSDGAVLLSTAAKTIMGPAGIWVFGLIMFLACMGTAVGLMGASAEYFNSIQPKISYRTWVILCAVVGFSVSTMGLEQVLAVTGPLIGMLYPPAITLILLTFFEAIVKKRLVRTYKFAVAVATVWSILMLISSLTAEEGLVTSLIAWSPFHLYQMGWIVPTIVAAIIGFMSDLTLRSKSCVAD